MAGIMPGNRAPNLKIAVLVCIALLVCGFLTVASREVESLHVVGSRFLGTVWNQGHARASVVSQDGGFSYGVPDGSLWWFGDTFRGSRDETGKPHFAGGAVSCAVARLDGTAKGMPPVLRFLADNDGKVAQAIGFLPEESWDRNRIWPLGGIYLNGRSYVYYSLIELTGKGMWDFRSAGSGLAYSSQPLSVHARIRTPEGWRFPVAPSAVVMAGDWVYLFDVDKRDDRQGVWLSRVRPGEIEDPDAYRFYCGPEAGFTRDRSRQVLFLKDIYGQVSIAWNEYLGKYVLASSSDLFHPREIRFHAAEDILGPWAKVADGITVPEYMQGKKVELVYCTCFHPELFRDDGRIMCLTFSMHLEDSGFDANNEMVEVEVRSSGR